MKRIFFTIIFICIALIDVQGQSEWRIIPDGVFIWKKLRNTFVTSYYKHELEIESIRVMNNRSLLFRLRCPRHSLEYGSEVKVYKRGETDRYKEFATVHQEDSSFFLPGEMAQFVFDLSSLNQNGQYFYEIQLLTELKETFFVRVYLNTKEFEKPKGVETMPTLGFDYEEEQGDEDYIYSFIKDFPEFPGGNDEMKRYIRKNVSDKELWKSFKLHQDLGIGVVIDKDGSILYPEIVSGHLGELNKDIMRIINMMPKWKPGRVNGKKVKCRVYISIAPKVIDKLLP